MYLKDASQYLLSRKRGICIGIGCSRSRQHPAPNSAHPAALWSFCGQHWPNSPQCGCTNEFFLPHTGMFAQRSPSIIKEMNSQKYRINLKNTCVTQPYCEQQSAVDWLIDWLIDQTRPDQIIFDAASSGWLIDLHPSKCLYICIYQFAHYSIMPLNDGPNNSQPTTIQSYLIKLVRLEWGPPGEAAIGGAGCAGVCCLLGQGVQQLTQLLSLHLVQHNCPFSN